MNLHEQDAVARDRESVPVAGRVGTMPARRRARLDHSGAIQGRARPRSRSETHSGDYFADARFFCAEEELPICARHLHGRDGPRLADTQQCV